MIFKEIIVFCGILIDLCLGAQHPNAGQKTQHPLDNILSIVLIFRQLHMRSWMAWTANAHHAPTCCSGSSLNLGSFAWRGRPAEPAHRIARGQLNTTWMSSWRNSTSSHSMEKTSKLISLVFLSGPVLSWCIVPCCTRHYFLYLNWQFLDKNGL